MLKIPKMTMRERAFLYPYTAPEGAYLLKNGYQLVLPDDYDFSGRVAVLSVGSNRAPAQLYRKFGDHAEIPVTPVNLSDCDIVHVANLADYGAVPCTAFPSEGCHVTLNMAWLDCDQLQIMHATESLGQAYDWVEWDRQVITPLSHHLPNRLFGYAAIAGAFNLSGAGPYGLHQIAAQNRQFSAATQKQMQEQIYYKLCQSDIDIYRWVEQVQNDSSLREHIRQILQKNAVKAVHPPWTKSSDLTE